MCNKYFRSIASCHCEVCVLNGDDLLTIYIIVPVVTELIVLWNGKCIVRVILTLDKVKQQLHDKCQAKIATLLQ